MGFPDSRTERLWTAAVGGVTVVLVAGSLLFTDTVYGGFVWHYFWGPVYADAHGAACAVWNAGEPTLLRSTAGCAAAPEPVAYPGYTLVSEIGYALILIAALTGLVFLLRRLDVGEQPGFIYPLIPFVFFGGALRVVEDANDAVPAGIDPAIQYPLNALIISPLIYFTVFFLTLAALVASVWLWRRGRTDTFEWPLAGVGMGLLATTLGYLVVLSATTGYVTFHPAFTVLTLLLATVIAGGIWWMVREYVPEIARGTPIIGGVVLWAHAVDGVSNVLGIDWGAELGLPRDLVPKHPVNRLVVDVANAIVPPGVQAVIGTAWAFLLLKIVAALAVIWVFDERMFEDSPRFAVLLLIAVIAVGLGPGTRDMLRATFGV
ncbi:MAG: DUF63 family protein [Halodesulfurarchaeum sp.]